jgi:CheY-like chemotaxis protein
VHAALAGRCPADERIIAAILPPPDCPAIISRGVAPRAAEEFAMNLHATPSPTTILVVDDQADNREMLSTLLSQEGYRTLTAAGGMEAMDLIASHHPQLILLDVSMPDMDGYAVASLLKADPKTAGIPIIMVTAHAGRGARVVGLHTGVEDYLTKPVDAPELLLKVRNLLRLSGNGEVSARRHA